MAFQFNPFTGTLDKVDPSADQFVIVNISSSTALTANSTHLVDTSASRSLSLPDPSTTNFVRVKDSTGNARANNITITRFAAEQIEGASASFIINSERSSYTFVSDGTNWDIL